MSVPPEWTPERTIGAALAARVIAEQFPDLAHLPVIDFDAGWDNVVLAVGEQWLFRFIHRAIALDGAQRELAVLTHLAGRFAVPIPWPQHIGRPTPEVPWPFWGTRALPGHELAIAGLPDADRTPVAAALGTFLRGLHAPDLAAETVSAVADAGVTLPLDPMRRADPSRVVPRARARIEALVTAGTWAPPRAVLDLLGDAEHLAAPDGEPVLLHGDLHSRHVLVHDGALSGVIDWGDTAVGDPAVDLMIAYGAFVGVARDAFLDAYGPVAPERELRARALAVHVNAALLQYSAGEGMMPLHRESLNALDRAVR